MTASDRSVDDPLPPELAFLSGGGAATRLILERDWSDHPLGPPTGWPSALKVALGLVLNSPESMILSWNPDDLVFFFNETYFPLLGPRLEWAMGAPFREVWADAWDQAEPIIRDAYAGNSQRFVDLPWKLDTDRGAAETWWSFSYSRVLDEHGAIAGLFIFTNETTARVLADRALEKSQAELRTVNALLERRIEARTAERDRMWNTSPDLMVVLSPEGVYRQVNPAWTELLGYEQSEIVGLTAVSLTHPDDLDATVHALATAQADRLPIFENRFQHKDGTYRWIQWTAAPGPNEIFAIGRHVTAMKEAEARLQQAEDQLRQAQKMEAVGQLTGGIAHDFNNMLTGVIGSLDMLKRRLVDQSDERVARYIDTATISAQRAAGLTQRLLAFSRRQSLDVRATDVNSLVLGMEELLRRSVGENVSVELDLDGAAWPGLTDANQLESALLNLALNARDAMPQGGRLTLSTRNQRSDDETSPTRGYVAIRVSDTGSGMAPDVVQRAFDPFFTTKPIGSGTGLGLSMIYGFVTQTGGEIRIDSEPGRGTMIELLLPRSVSDAELVADRTTPRMTAVPGSCVLLVEDEAAVRMLIAELLDELGYEVRQAADGDDAIRQARSMGRIDLLITDVGLPGMNGRVLADRLRSERPGLRVLFVTGYAEQATQRAEFLASGMEMVTKPFDVNALSVKIREMIDGSGENARESAARA